MVNESIGVVALAPNNERIMFSKYPCEKWSFVEISFREDTKGEMAFIISEGEINRIIKFINNPSFVYDVSDNNETMLRVPDITGNTTMFITYKNDEDSFHFEIGQYSDSDDLEEYEDVEFECEYELSTSIHRMIALRDKLFSFIRK